jgi:hypothetical protein
MIEVAAERSKSLKGPVEDLGSWPMLKQKAFCTLDAGLMRD